MDGVGHTSLCWSSAARVTWAPCLQDLSGFLVASQHSGLADHSHLDTPSFQDSHFPSPPHPWAPGLFPRGPVFSVEPHPTCLHLPGLCVGPLHLPPSCPPGPCLSPSPARLQLQGQGAVSLPHLLGLLHTFSNSTCSQQNTPSPHLCGSQEHGPSWSGFCVPCPVLDSTGGRPGGRMTPNT